MKVRSLMSNQTDVTAPPSCVLGVASAQSEEISFIAVRHLELVHLLTFELLVAWMAECH